MQECTSLSTVAEIRNFFCTFGQKMNNLVLFTVQYAKNITIFSRTFMEDLIKTFHQFEKAQMGKFIFTAV